MSSEQEIASFVSGTFRSVWTLELLCHLRHAAPQAFSPDELIASLRASELVVRQGVAELVAAGLVAVEADGVARYAPATDELDRLTAAVEASYAKSPDAIRRIIVRAANPGLSAFSDAFRLRGKP